MHVNDVEEIRLHSGGLWRYILGPNDGRKPLKATGGCVMKRTPQAWEVRALVAQILEELGAMVECAGDVDETILIDDGHYVAGSYRADGYMAMWMVAVGILQFYDAEGEMLRTVNLFEEMEPQRMAA
jgi:hypothetical protein